MSLWKKLKNLWVLSGYEPVDVTKKMPKKGTMFPGFPKTEIDFIPKRPATIVEDELPDLFEENNDKTSQ